METNTEPNVQFIPYKEDTKQKARDKYDSLSSEEKKKQQEYKKEWYKNLPVEKKEQLKEKHREYQKKKKNTIT